MNDLALINKGLRFKPDDPNVYLDAITIYYDRIQHGFPQFHKENKELRKKIGEAIRRNGNNMRIVERLNDAYYKSLLIDSPVDLDAYCQYIEKDRDVRKRFYLPRRRQLLPVVRSLQRLMDDEIDLLGISLPPGVGKTTLAIFLLTWVA